MTRNRPPKKIRFLSREAGFSLLEMLLSVALLLIVGGIVMTGMVKMTKTQGTIVNRTQVHDSVRGATELLQQEIGQAGRIALPSAPAPDTYVKLTGPVTGSPTLVQSVAVNSTAGMYSGEQLTIDSDANQETVTLTADPTGGLITAIFTNSHPVGAAVRVLGGFAAGVVPTAGSLVNGTALSTAQASSGNVLKLYGDINGDGNMMYVVYTCDTANGFLYRNMQPMFTTAIMPPNDQSMVLIDDLLPNPDGSACFTYQTKTVTTNTYVVNVAVTLTVRTQYKDPQSGQYQSETKALLNVGPRNVFDTWELAGNGNTNRVQPMPLAVTNLLAQL